MSLTQLVWIEMLCYCIWMHETPSFQIFKIFIIKLWCWYSFLFLGNDSWIDVMVRSLWPECHFVCFPNGSLGVRRANGSYLGTIRCVLRAYWQFGSVFGSLKIFVCMFKIFSSAFRMWRPCLFWNYSGSILRAYGMYGKRTAWTKNVRKACV